MFSILNEQWNPLTNGTGMNPLTYLVVQDSHLHQPRLFIVLLNKNFYYIVTLSLARFIVRAVLTVALMILLCDSIIKIFKIDINQKPQSWLHKEITKLVLSTIIILADSVPDSGYTKTKEAFQILNSIKFTISPPFWLLQGKAKYLSLFFINILQNSVLEMNTWVWTPFPNPSRTLLGKID